MDGGARFGKLDTAGSLDWHLGALVLRDPRLLAVRERAGDVALRIGEPGFAGLARIVCGQQLSVASANAIWMRLAALDGALHPAGFLLLDEPLLRRAGLSAGKVRTLRAVAEASVAGALDFAHLETLPADEAITAMTILHGVGPWTAELYLLFCAAHPDIFPAGDLALQKAVAHGLGLDQRPLARDLVALAAGWAPHRGAAALLFWRYFAAINRRDGVAAPGAATPSIP
jgi:DNA-3-methyladenine glycosylase II